MLEWIWEWFWPRAKLVKGDVHFWAKKEYLESKKAIIGSVQIACDEPFPCVVRARDPNDTFIYLV
jgi:hypothetical protein